MIVILDNIRSAFNVGSIIRTCNGLGIKDIYFCGITPDIKNKKVQKTSLGAEENIDENHYKNTLEAISVLRENGYQIIGLEILKGSEPINKLQTNNKVALVVGNEVSGISKDVLEKCDVVSHIPMKGDKESFNVSVAFAIAAYTLTLDK